MEHNHDIDKKFNEASKTKEEVETFPGFDEVWKNIEEKLDKKETKKRILPIWFPYGIAASLLIGFGTFYFISKEDAKPSLESSIAKNKTVLVDKNTENSIQKIDSIIQKNIKKEIAETQKKLNFAVNKPYKGKIIDKAKNDSVFMARKSSFEADEYYIEKKEVSKSPILASNEIYKEESSPIIKEVVVTGSLGIKKKVSATTSSSRTISMESRSKSSLSGSVAGISMESPSSTSKLMIRGMSGIDKTSKPLVIVDGKPIPYENFIKIDPNFIKSINVLKSNTATAIYGTKAVNGVLIVETKNLSNAEKRKLLRKIKNSKKSIEKDIEVVEEKELPKAGQLTAGEINDFSKWNYCKDIAVPTLDQYKNEWKFFPEKRISVQLINEDKKPIVGEKVKLLNEKNEIIWEAVSDNLGNAEMWVNPMMNSDNSTQNYALSDSKGKIISRNLKEFKNGQNIVVLDRSCLSKRALDIAFVVDATGSMGDEISYLQSELLDVLKKVETNLKTSNVRYGSVFYRDNGDEYVTKKFDFTNKAEDLVSFIKKQSANGGGDTPEAVVEALQVSIDELKWSDENTTKIMFLILDAPPHHSEENIKKLYEKIKWAAKKGITIIPLAASDTDKQTEYLMRTFALLTNGTYTFLTNDSGIGNNHIAPTIDSFEVEKLNELLLRLILQRATLPKCKRGISNDFINKKMETEIKNQSENKISFYPNPTKGLLSIKSNEIIDELFVYDLAGKIIMRKENLVGNKNIVDLTSYPQSVYLIRVRTKDKWETFKVIKN